MASLLAFSLPKPNSIKASSLTTIQSPYQVLEEKFGRKGIKFRESVDGITAVELTVRNGSSLSLRISDGVVTSYKPKVYWKDEGFEEILYTIPDGGSVKGGVGLILNDVSTMDSQCCVSDWVVKDVDSDSIDALQVELQCTNGDGTLEIKYVVSLYALSMATSVIVKNNGPQTVKLTSAILSHLKFKTRRGSAIQGLKGCSYCTHPPLSSSFGIMSPTQALEAEPPGWFSFLGSGSNDKGNSNEESWSVEDNIYTMMKHKMSRVYTAPPMERLKRIYSTPPSKYETIDQGSGLGFRVMRMGYDDIYLCSPGSLSQNYGKDYFICTGPASMLVPVVLNPGEGWRGAQVIQHDNL
ncbi:NDH-dependent cyclic electron flow 1 isoform X2 [Tasmannia lanceolata]|uniref:NDH-dependent cyclic electron flow 1 isoform X2 n=1 Tax=Tasmannia lanceolata TaxID=3420 RepID=UPI00406426DF